MNKLQKEERYVRDKNFLLKEFALYYSTKIKLAGVEIKLNPIPPPNNDNWKILNQFETKNSNGMVCSYKISFEDRVVYEYYPNTSDIVFTNCKGHYFRDKRFSSNDDIGETKTLSSGTSSSNPCLTVRWD